MFFYHVSALVGYSRPKKKLLKKYIKSTKKIDIGLSKQMAEYMRHKENYVRNIKFDPSSKGLSKHMYP